MQLLLYLLGINAEDILSDCIELHLHVVHKFLYVLAGLVHRAKVCDSENAVATALSKNFCVVKWICKPFLPGLNELAKVLGQVAVL